MRTRFARVGLPCFRSFSPSVEGRPPSSLLDRKEDPADCAGKLNLLAIPTPLTPIEVCRFTVPPMSFRRIFWEIARVLPARIQSPPSVIKSQMSGRSSRFLSNI